MNTGLLKKVSEVNSLLDSFMKNHEILQNGSTDNEKEQAELELNNLKENIKNNFLYIAIRKNPTEAISLNYRTNTFLDAKDCENPSVMEMVNNYAHYKAAIQ